ncbi:type V CRISPR-associated protein Cas12b [Alicyclobacillus sp.]|uniref:type V CRISPR-associated protein Cas12b n=1 Tax=Alicyclobacillus sp. TaxID=61169 RepID=UPI0025B98F40|nr:type V CRISPR-associated protein Cas12b [Alicyclobacillus sp.]
MKVKLMVGNLPEIREGMWHLHEAINAGVRYYTEWLALLRQGNLYKRGADGRQELYMTAEQCQEELLRRLRERQRKNGHAGDPGTNEELLSVARRLYELLIPQAVGKTGSAQMLARNFLSPLADRNSRGATDEEVILLLNEYGLRPLFDVFTETYERIKWKELRKGQGVRAWDRDMFQQALERLMSWESWNRRVGEEYAKLVYQRDRLQSEHFDRQEHLVALVKRLEADMMESSQGFSVESADAHRVRNRALRGGKDIIAEWMNVSDSEPIEAFIAVIKRKQAKDPRKFGSYDLFCKLAEPQYRPLWREDPSFLERWATRNVLERKISKAKPFATFTKPNPFTNPVWTRFDKPNGTNIFEYKVVFDHFGLGQHAVEFERMVVMQQGVPTEVENVRVPLAPSRQFNRLRSVEAGSSEEISLDDPAAPGPFCAEFGGAKIQYHRARLQRIGRNQRGFEAMLTPGLRTVAERAGDVFLNLSLRVSSQSEARGERRPAYDSLFRISERTMRVTVRYDRLAEYLESHPDDGTPGSEGLQNGLRVMSVDLGLRTAASISVFRLARRDELPPAEDGRSPFYFPVHGSTDLVAVHERSHLIRLPGETETKRVRQIREARMESLNRLRAQLSLLRAMVRLGVPDEHARKRNWDRLSTHLERVDARVPAEFLDRVRETIAMLERKSTLTGDAWTTMVQASVRPLWRALAKDVRDWRRAVRSGDKVKVKGRAIDVPGGQSIAQLEYLERQYRFLRSWSSFSVEAGQVVRAQRDSRFAVSLREHLDNAKQDRLKKLADRILMEALGYVHVADGRGPGRWEAKYPPCQLILLEELSAYRFHEDRPPSENRQLRVWSHRGVLAELINQAQVHDVLVGTIPAAFSSRFDARTGTPGVRCRRVPEAGEGVPVWLSRYLEREKLDLEQLRPGQLIPTGDGEFFVSPLGHGADAGIRVVHADLNAAHNLQKRLWENFDLSDIRLRGDVQQTDNEVILVPRLTNKRMEKNYKNQIFVSGDGKAFHAMEGKRKVKGLGRKAEQEELSEDELEFLAEADDAQQRSMVLFRDPSGCVNGGRWTEQKAFWGAVKARVDKQLREHYTLCPSR